MNAQDVLNALGKAAADLLVFALTIVAGVLTVYVKRWITAKAAEVEAKLTPDERGLLDYIIPVAVDAAESKSMASLLGKGQAKLEYACGVATDYLKSRGIDYIDVGTIAAKVEAEVLRSYNADKVTKPGGPPAPPPPAGQIVHS